MGELSLEVQYGRLSAQLEAIQAGLIEDRKARKGQYESMEAIRASVSNLSHRMGDVEDRLGKMSPTIDEFIEIKNKVHGAGKLGSWLWAIGALLLTAAYKFRAEILSLLPK